MKITLSGSIAFIKEMQEIKQKLEKLGHSIKMPEKAFKLDSGELVTEKKYLEIMDNEDNFKKFKNKIMLDFYEEKIKWCDAVLVINPEKNGQEGYIGANTFLEMGGAFFLNKKIFILNDFGKNKYKEEIDAMYPVIINNDLEKIKL
ncbi:MAG: hypothetical protein N4A38_03990 [Candidatus Gracilibacteria bacterium]|nr:hypothetical protein [Candidatus Gracilibacteria bacterium]